MNLQFVKSMLEIALSDSGGNKIPHTVEVIDAEKEEFKVIIPDPKGEVAYITRILESAYLVPVPEYKGTEIAKYGGLEYTTKSELANDEEEPEGDSVEREDEENGGEETASVTFNEDGSMSISVPGNLMITGGPVKINNRIPKTAETARSLDTISDESRLKILKDPDMLKMANKIYDMINASDDKSNYAAFLYNLDDFFHLHKVDTDYSDDGEDDDTIIEAPGPNNELASAFTKKQLKVAVASMFGSTEVAAAFIDKFGTETALEIAKKKKGSNPRAQLLSKFMTGMSGEKGASAISAWESKDKDKLKSALDGVVEEVVNAVETSD